MSKHQPLREHDIEPIPGLPGRLPQGEALLWQGAPRWEPLARRAFHMRKLAIYFAVLLVWYASSVVGAHEGVLDQAVDLLRATGLAAAAIGLVGVFAWLVARSTLYTVTSRRIVIRFGIALPMTVNIPFGKIEAAAVKANPDGTGDILLTLAPTEKMSYLILWPHVRPRNFRRVQPLLRAVPECVRVAQLFGRAVAAGSTAPVALGMLDATDNNIMEPRPGMAAAA